MNCKQCNVAFTATYNNHGSVSDLCSLCSLANDCDRDDPVNHPAHYTQGGIECIDAIEAALTPDEFRGFCKGNAMKYVHRERHKGGNESLRKAIWYLKRIT